MDLSVLIARLLGVLVGRGVISMKDKQFICCEISEAQWLEDEEKEEDV